MTKIPRRLVGSPQEAVDNLKRRPWNPTNPEWWKDNVEYRLEELGETVLYQWLANEYIGARAEAIAQERARLRAAVERLANCDVSYHALLKSDVLALLASPSPDPEPPDPASEYGRLLAERDRLIAEGADPDELALPLAPSPDPEEPR